MLYAEYNGKSVSNSIVGEIVISIVFRLISGKQRMIFRNSTFHSVCFEEFCGNQFDCRPVIKQSCNHLVCHAE